MKKILKVKPTVDHIFVEYLFNCDVFKFMRMINILRCNEKPNRHIEVKEKSVP